METSNDRKKLGLCELTTLYFFSRTRRIIDSTVLLVKQAVVLQANLLERTNIPLYRGLSLSCVKTSVAKEMINTCYSFSS